VQETSHLGLRAAADGLRRLSPCPPGGDRRPSQASTGRWFGTGLGWEGTPVPWQSYMWSFSSQGPGKLRVSWSTTTGWHKFASPRWVFGESWEVMAWDRPQHRSVPVTFGHGTPPPTIMWRHAKRRPGRSWDNTIAPRRLFVRSTTTPTMNALRRSTGHQVGSPRPDPTRCTVRGIQRTQHGGLTATGEKCRATTPSTTTGRHPSDTAGQGCSTGSCTGTPPDPDEKAWPQLDR